MSKIYIKRYLNYIESTDYFKKINNIWQTITQSEFLSRLSQTISIFGGIGITRFEIMAPTNLTAESCQCNAALNGEVISSGVTWNIISGGEYATIDSTGLVTVSSVASSSTIVISATYNGNSDTHTMSVTYKSGSTSDTTINTVVDEQGNSTTTVTTVTENENGTTSSESTSITYNTDGDPIEKVNENVDTSGNVSTQEIEYDENGEEVVVGYTIDTSNNPSGSKNYNGDGVNTEYYALDATQGFIMDIHFTIDFTSQPAGQNDSHHNIINSKRATPEPWYGFQIRHTGTNKYINLGTQFETGANTNAKVTTTDANKYNGSASIYEYNFHIVYDPTAANNNFVCDELIGGYHVSYNNVFPDIPDLEYIKTTIGYALDANGDAFRFSNINVFSFLLEKLPHVASPSITCDGHEVTMTCETTGADIYYRINQTGSYVQYTAPISINADTTFEAYAQLNGDKSKTTTELCVYDNGIATPVISCDGEYVSIACATTDATLYYRLNETGTFSEYNDSFQINATTVVEAYAVSDGQTGHTAKETCVYSPVILVAPTILCNGEQITITCNTANAEIYYRLNQEGSYIAYTTPISILQDTFVEAYSSYRGRISSVVNETCEYSPVHHYENDYLTFRIRTAGNVYWRANGSLTKTIEYSLNGGTWTSITSAATPVAITVATNDVVRFRGSNATYATSKTAYSGFGHGEAGTSGQSTYDNDAAEFDIEGNIMSLVYGDNFVGQTTFNGSTYNFCSLFKKAKCVSAENMILPALTLREYCYRAMFSLCPLLTKAPALPATTLGQGCYWYMFEACPITNAPELPASSLVRECYGYMFTGCSNLNYIKCLAADGFSTYQCTQDWVTNVAPSGTFVKNSNVTWNTGNNGIPTSWVVVNEGEMTLEDPVITCDGEEVTITCATQGAEIYYNINQNRSYTLYTEPIPISEDVTVDAYAVKADMHTNVITQGCVYNPETPLQASNKDITSWRYNGLTVTTPYSVNAIDGHSSSYAKGTFNFEADVKIKKVQPTYLWFQHADQSASVYIDNTLVEKHWGGYNAFFVDISNFIHKGMNTIKVAVKNNEGNYLAPCNGDFNFNATLGNVKLFTSPVLPAMDYGYDGFHVTSVVSSSLATVTVRTSVPNGASVKCTISDGVHNYTETKNSNGEELSFIDTIQNPHLWNGTIDPHLYTITLEVYYEGELYHRYQRPYGLRFYRYAINDTTILPNNEPYTGFLLNGSPYLLRGVCMHDDIDGKANALSASDYVQEFAIIQELGCNFIRLAHYPHPKEVYDRCDQLGIVVQTEGPCVNKLQSTMPTDYYTHLETQYSDMVNQHYNHPCIMFWGLSNETTTDDKAFGKTKIEGYTTLIKNLDSERMVGYVLAQSPGTSPSAYYNDPAVDWFGCNIYVGWYDSPNSNTPTSQINTRLNNTIDRVSKPMAYSEYGCGGTQRCHSDDPLTTTTRGNYERHDIEYMMWLHEGHIATIKQYPQLLFTSQWQLFDIAVANRNEGYTVCLDGETTSVDDSLRRLNDKGLVERDHITKKDPFYLYKAWWNPDSKFVHICGKDYQKLTDRVIKCYSNDGNSFSLYVNNTFIETVNASDNIVLFTSRNFTSGDVVRVEGNSTNDTFTFV